jgi:diacylglycerol kinase family enzyme
MIAAALLHPDVSPRVVDRFRGSGVEIRIQDHLEGSSNLSAAFIFGGDGTVHRHLPQLHEKETPTLVVPAGSGNDFAKSIGTAAWKSRCARGSGSVPIAAT